jgi:HK97 family phage portal protein
MGLLAKALTAFGRKSVEGEYREGPYYLPFSGGWLTHDVGQNMNWWQLGHDVTSGGSSAMVEACIASYAQTVAMCPGNHWRWTKESGRERVTNSALVRILRAPNDYQTISDFLMNMARWLLEDGNAYAVVIRNNRFEPVELHLMNSRQSGAQLAPSGEVFYHLGGNPVVDARYGTGLVVPGRDVLHVRLQTPRHPLVGESPIRAAALQLAAGNAALTQQIKFFLNQARPSFVLSTDNVLTKEQAGELRDRWNEQAAGMNKGGTPILTAGLKAQPIGTSAKDSELADLLKMSDQSVASVFRIPPQILGLGDKAPFASTEALMQSWRAGGLGFLLNHIEEAFGLLFKLTGQPDEYVEFDTSALMRSAFKDRVEGWVSGVKGGIFDRNAARQDFEMAPVKGGSEPWVQQQDVPLSVAEEQAKNPPPSPELPEPAVVEEPAPDPEQERAFAALFEKELRERVNA